MDNGDFMIDILQSLGLQNNLNINPVSIEFGNEITTSKWIGKINATIEQLLNVANQALQQNTNYIDGKFNDFVAQLTQLRNDLNNGNIIPNYSISIEKLNQDFYNQLENTIKQRISNIVNVVWFGIDDNGYFYAVIPEGWNDVNFSTNTNDCLVLEY